MNLNLNHSCPDWLDKRCRIQIITTKLQKMISKVCVKIKIRNLVLLKNEILVDVFNITMV